MKDWIRVVVGEIIVVILSGMPTECKTQETAEKRTILGVRIPPLIVANADTSITDSYEVLSKAGQELAAQCVEWDVTAEIMRFDYTEENKYITGYFDINDAANILLEGYFNIPGYIHTGRVVSLDDIIMEEIRADTDDMLWGMSQVGSKIYMLPHYSPQNALIYNRDLSRQCGLAEYIGGDGMTQNWTLEEWGYTLSILAAGLPEITHPMLMYAKNDQGDTHIMTLLCNKGSPLFDENRRFSPSTKEGIAALWWVADSYQGGYFPADRENMETVDCSDLFISNQSVIHMVNSATLSSMDRSSAGVTNFPSLNRNGHNTSFATDSKIFDSGDQEKVQAARDFLRYSMSTRELMNYAWVSIPASNITTERVS